MRISSAEEQPERGGKRGVVRGFSKSSRRRMIRELATIRNECEFFLTLTYPDLFPVAEPRTWAAHFEAFRRRFERAFDGWSAVWRQEIKPRQSGVNLGVDAPHFHLLIYPPDGWMEGAPSKDTTSRLIMAWARRAWYEIVGSEDDKHLRHGAHCAPVRNRRHMYSYASKYIAKCDDDDHAIGRRWGRIGTFDTSASIEIALTFREAIELRRLIAAWMRRKSRFYARHIARQTIENEYTALGLGDSSHHMYSKNMRAAIEHFITHARQLAADTS